MNIPNSNRSSSFSPILSETNGSHLITIFGDQMTIYDWLTIDEKVKGCYNVNGLIVHDNQTDMTVVVTSRAPLFGCKEITGYYFVFKDGKEYLFRMELTVAFTSLDFNLMILVTKNKKYFDYSAGIMLNKSGIWTGILFDPYQLNNNVINEENTLSLVTLCIKINSKKLEFSKTEIFLKDCEFIIKTNGYLPRSIYYHATLSNEYYDVFDAIIGTAVFDQNNTLFGLITCVKNDGIIEITPHTIVKKIITDYVFNYQEKNYNGLSIWNVDMNGNIVTKNKRFKSVDNKFINITTGDKLIMINNYEVCSLQDTCYIFDEQLSQNVPIDIWVRIHIEPKKIIEISYVHKEDIITKKIFLDSHDEITFPPLSASKPFFPSGLLEYININGLIITSLSHELLCIMYNNGIKINNDIVNNDNELNKKILLILDNVKKFYGIPSIAEKIEKYRNTMRKNKKEVNIYYIVSVNDVPVTTLEEINKHEMKLLVQYDKHNQKTIII